MGQDQLFKTILEGLLQDFLELFFPGEAARLDFETLQFVGKEVFANVPEGEVREADVVAQLETKDGRPKLILVHVEIQAEDRGDFPRRMFEYYSVLRIHYGFPVFPVALYLRGGPPARVTEYHEDLFGQEVLTFRYNSIALERLPAEEYVGTGPLGAALSALMSSKGQDRAALMASMMGRVSEGGLNDVLKHLLVDVIKTYLVLTPEELERYRQILARKEFGAVQEVELTWSEKLREAGIVEGKRKTLLRLLSAKFGRVPEAITAKAGRMSEAELDSVLDRILTATTLDDLGFGD